MSTISKIIENIKASSNVGETGVKSIRLNGMRIENLPMAEREHARVQIPDAIRTEIENRVNNILNGYPKHSVVYLNSRIRECESNIKRMGDLKAQENNTITLYSGHIAMCKFRDDEIAKLDPVANVDEIKSLKKRFPPYNVEAMNQQIKQSRESIDRADEVIASEYTSISELREVLVMCERRNTLLRNLGAKVIE